MSTDLPRAEDAILEKVAERAERVKCAQERLYAATERAAAAMDAFVRQVVREELSAIGLIAPDDGSDVSHLSVPVLGGGSDV